MSSPAASFSPGLSLSHVSSYLVELASDPSRKWLATTYRHSIYATVTAFCIACQVSHCCSLKGSQLAKTLNDPSHPAACRAPPTQWELGSKEEVSNSVPAWLLHVPRANVCCLHQQAFTLEFRWVTKKIGNNLDCFGSFWGLPDQ